MKTAILCQPPERTALKVDIANLSPSDARFIRDVIDILTDDAMSAHATAIRSGSKLIAYSGGGITLQDAAYWAPPIYIRENTTLN